jgi:hypothetical protein
VAKSLSGEGTAVLSISSHHGTRTAVLSPSPAPVPGAHLGVIPGRASTALNAASSARLERSGIRAGTDEPLVSPG